jgi:hypothetical protein
MNCGTEPSSYYLRGPVDPTVGFLFVVTEFSTCTTENVSCPFVSFLTINGDQLVFDPTVTPNSNNVVIVTANTSGTGVIFSVESNNNTTSNNNIIVTQEVISNNLQYIATLGNTSTQLTINTTTVNNWGFLLTGVDYSFQSNNSNVLWPAYIGNGCNVSNGRATSLVTDANGNPEIKYYSNQIRAIPVMWYVGGSCSDVIQDIPTIISLEQAWVSGQLSQTPIQGPNGNLSIDTGYTNTTDCNVGVFYNYCPLNRECSLSCKGPCNNSAENGITCLFNNKSNGFVCEQAADIKPWYQQIWFHILLASLIIILVIVIFLIIYRFNK